MTAHGLSTDIRHVVRRLLASPSFSLVAVLSLGLAVGANTAVVSVARAALFDTLPIERPHELSFVFWGPRIDGLSGMYSDGRLDPATGKQMSSNISFPAYQELQQLQRPGVFRPVTDIPLPLALQPLLVPGWTPRQGALFTDPHTLWVRAVVRLPEGGGAAFEQMASASLRAQVVAAGITDT